MDLAPLQLYSSAIIFTPQKSIVRNICGRLPKWIHQWPLTPTTWGPELQKLEGHASNVTSVAFSPNGSLLASASHDGTLRLWNPRTGQEVQTLAGHTDCVLAVVFSYDGSMLASASSDRTVRLWNPRTGQEVQTLARHTYPVTAVIFSHDGSLLASASSDQTLRLWNPRTGQEVQTLKGHTDFITAVVFSPDGSLVASASSDKTVRLWDSTTGQEVQTLAGHTYWVSAVVFSYDGSLLASTSGDKTVRLWNPADGKEIQKLDVLHEVRNLEWTMDNRILLTDRGTLCIDTIPILNTTSACNINNIMFLSQDWVWYNNRQFLWLPQEYRSDVSAFHGNTFAIGRNSGQVCFIQLNPYHG